jgi:hypothetical protein
MPVDKATFGRFAFLLSRTVALSPPPSSFCIRLTFQYAPAFVHQKLQKLNLEVINKKISDKMGFCSEK